MSKEQRLIDADKIVNGIALYMAENAYLNDTPLDALKMVANWITEAPPVDAVEVVHAEWLDIVFDPMWGLMSATCSHCMVRGEVRVKRNECGFAVPDSDYCPNCGASMDGGINNGTLDR